MSGSTIAAISTAGGVGAVGIIRVSGPEAVAVLRKVVPTFPSDPLSHHLYLREIADDSESIDRALVALMRGPHSFTGEDVVELHCHGGPVHLRTVLDLVLSKGAVPAEAGEFTRRAFLNGRLDLAQAEAIADLINARSEVACKLARRHLEGGLSRKISSVRERLAKALVLVEAGIDFSLEEHVFSVDSEGLERDLSAISAEIGQLLATYDTGRVQREGIRCVIAGRPNAGKSSLLNALLDEERAIVSEIPGTTRDYLDAGFSLDGNLFTLVDTAGLRDTQDTIEAEGVRRANKWVDSADLVLYVVDRSVDWDPLDTQILERLTSPTLLLLNKCDLPARAEVPPLSSSRVSQHDVQLDNRDVSAPNISADLHDLLLAESKRAGLIDSSDSVTIARARHREALERSRSHLETARSANLSGLGYELVALDLRLSLDAVGEVIGAVSPDEILGRIFSEFCVGK